MKIHLIILFLLSLSAYKVSAQTIYSVKYPNQADVKVFVTKYPNQADLLVYKVNYKYQAKDYNGLWFFTKYDYQASKKIFFVNADYKADLKIFFVNARYKAKWKNSSKKSLMY